MDAFTNDFTFDLGPAVGGIAGGSSPVLERNLRAIARLCPRTAARIASASPATNLEWVESEEDRPGLVWFESASVVADPFAMGGGEAETTHRVLASRRRPVTEGERLASTVDVVGYGGACVLGFGAGYHCAALGQRFGEHGAVICFEADLGLLRAVLERVDHSGWIGKTNFVLLTDSEDGAAIAASVRGIEGILALGVKILEHPASRSRLGASAGRFSERFAATMRTLRTSVMTTLVHAQASLRNILTNADYYASCAGLGALAGAAHGRAAVVVSAGPSLERNIDLLRDPGARDRVVVIAAQTVLKPLLRRGIRPDFVCALDYHEISRRFYEGLTPADVEGVTLVVEPKANPAILESFPGRILCVQEEMLDSVLGGELGGAKWPLRPGATVAHLCAYLARHLGCDPLILVGQDLGFTDGQYYAAGAAIHDVWAGELGPMRTLEMFEWERIVRAHSLLRRAQDIHGRPIYTDEQMATYLAQFEVDFAADEASGLRVIDATEGGVRKAHTEVMTLREALDRFATGDPIRLPTPGGARERAMVAPPVAARLEEVAAQSDAVESCSRRAAEILGKMIGASSGEVDRLIDRVYAVRDEVRALEPAYGLVQFVNQAGALRRFRADRTIELATGLDEQERQVRQIERDITNVEWTGDAAAELARQLRRSAASIRGERDRQTADPTPEGEGVVGRGGKRVAALLGYDHEVNGLGLSRAGGFEEGLIGGVTPLRGTVERLLRSEELDEIVVMTGDAVHARRALGPAADDPRVAIEPVDGSRLRARTRAVGRARLLSPEAWRGALGGLSCYDESFEPVLAAGVMARRGVDAAVLVGADWMLVDPALVSAVARRYRERSEVVRLSLTQGVPGLCGLLLDRESIESLASGLETALNFATVGGLLAYLPIAPQGDPIAKAFCVPVGARVRDAGRRFVPDTPEGVSLVATVIGRLGPSWRESGADEVVSAAPGVTRRFPEGARHLQLELGTRRLAGGLFGRWARGGGGGGVGAGEIEMPTDAAVRLVEALAAGRPDTVLTLHGAGDPLLHPGVYAVIAAARAAGVGLVHLRTDALADEFDADRLIASGADVISVDVLAATPGTYVRMAGVDRYELVKSRAEALLERRGRVAGLPGVWVVPRITRCDEVYEEIEAFYGGWLMASGGAVIDPIPEGAGLPATARIRPLPLPGLARARRDREMLIVRADGWAYGADGTEAGDVFTAALDRVWRAIGRAERVAA